MSTVQNLIDRARGELNEASAIFYADTDPQLLGWIVEGLQQQHARVKSKLNGALPDPHSLYWLSFLTGPTAIAVATGTQEKDLPSDFDILIALVDEKTNEQLGFYPRHREKVFARGSKLGVNQGPGLYTFATGNKIRVLVWPGAEGVPVGARNINITYYKKYPRHTVVGDTVIIPDEFTEGAVLYAVGKGFVRKKMSPVEVWQAAQQAADMIS